jgi:hypothetical protein
MRPVKAGRLRSPPPAFLSFLFDALDSVDAEVGILAADLLLEVAAATVLPCLSGIHVRELEDANAIRQWCT